MGDNIDKILEGRRQQAPAPTAAPEDEADKFYSVLGGDLVDDPFVEFRFRDGFRLALPYRDVVWISCDPEGEIKMDFGSTTMVIKGRGLSAGLFDGLKQKRVIWIQEASTEMQDHDKNKVFVADIGFEREESEATPT
jgi:hypothetical protein